MSQEKDRERQGTTGGAQFYTQRCCLLHVTDASLGRCTRNHAFPDARSLAASAVFVQDDADEKRRKKHERPTKHGA
jgi:hypothetical protein